MKGARGERTIKVGDREVTVLYTNRALAGAEKRLGKGILSVAQGFTSGESGIFEVVTLLHVGMEAYRVDSKSSNRPVSMDDAYEVIDEVGFTAIAAPVMEAVSDVLAYNGDTNKSGSGPDPN